MYIYLFINVSLVELKCFVAASSVDGYRLFVKLGHSVGADLGENLHAVEDIDICCVEF